MCQFVDLNVKVLFFKVTNNQFLDLGVVIFFFNKGYSSWKTAPKCGPRLTSRPPQLNAECVQLLFCFISRRDCVT